MIYLIDRDAGGILRISGLTYYKERMTLLRMLNVFLKIRSVLSVFILHCGSSELFAVVTREKLVFGFLATFQVSGLLSHGQKQIRSSFLTFLLLTSF